ncbi:sugar transferase [Pararhizobium mangrovi]|uniref:Exopolysaccharide biosynthesis protein n=1 Tax=Pararhizobium mangrovi TaxID=2590452 RepID=A0A506U5R8_9HYPH|nr:sugar transferase [Pararhizobium mangrovi]TPW27929.1 exopolysaccharide biosynthesis protein [Pararhizobium mangrovi]
MTSEPLVRLESGSASGNREAPFVDIRTVPANDLHSTGVALKVSPYLHSRTKRGLDITFALSLLLFFAPLFLLIALVVVSSSRGGVFFRQARGGRSGAPFRIVKFRSMRAQPVDAAVVQARRRDPRVTRVGRVLRATSTDELPQLINVLRGDMSMVGPRPHAIDHDRYYAAMVDGYTRRFAARPGITGLAQTSGCRGETTTHDAMQQRVDADLAYIANASFSGDMVILARTAINLLVDRNVY